MYVYESVCILVYIYVCECTRVCMHVWHAYMGTCVSVLCVCVNSPSSVCLVACYSDSDSFVRSELGNERLEILFVVDSIHCRFEDRPMG